MVEKLINSLCNSEIWKRIFGALAGIGMLIFIYDPKLGAVITGICAALIVIIHNIVPIFVSKYKETLTKTDDILYALNEGLKKRKDIL